MAQSFGRRRQIDRYDGQTIFIGNQVAYELGNYLGGGASGSVYQAFDVTSRNPSEKSVAIKILKPLGYKILPFGQLSKCIVASKGQPLNQKQIHGKAPLNVENLWWLVHPSSEHVYAAYEDASRGQLRELTLPRCIEIWGWSPLGSDQLSPEAMEKRNFSGQTCTISNISIIHLPTVAPKYLKWLQSRATICREMNNMIHIGEHPNIVDLLEVLELIQDSKAVLFLVLEFVNGGELFDRMKRSSGPGTPSDEFARRYFSQLLSGIDYCHCKGVVHRDLKPENLLLSDPSELAILKIADFGLSAVVFATEGVEGIFNPQGAFQSQGSGDNNKNNYSNTYSQFDYLSVTDKVLIGDNHQQSQSQSQSQHQHVHFDTNQPQSQSPIQILHSNMHGQSQSPLAKQQQQQLHMFSATPGTPSPVPLRRLRSVVGSPHYIAPEIVNHDDPCGYDGRKVDMWSAGVILYSLLTGSLPFGGDLSSCPRYKLYEQWMVSEYSVAVREGRGKEITLPGWFFPPSITPLAGSLILSLIHIDPQQRCTASEALKHPWSTGEITGMGAGTGTATSQVSSEVSNIRNQMAGARILFPDDGSHPSHNSVAKADKDKDKERDREREKERMKLKGQNKEQKEKRTSTPQSISAAASQSNTPRVNKPKSPPSVTTPALQIPVQFPRSQSPVENCPTRVALTSVATALVPFSIEVVRRTDTAVAVTVAVEEIIVADGTGSGTRRIRPQSSDEVRSATDVAVTHSRSDSISVTVIESSNQQPVVRRVSQNYPHPPPGPTIPEPPSAPLYGSQLSPPRHLMQPGAHSSQGVSPVAAVNSVVDVCRSRNEVSGNQTQQSGNDTSTRYSTRIEQSRERGQEGQSQDREEEERKERYRSILEQQRQKEAAALAMDPQGEHHTPAAQSVAIAGNREPGREPSTGSLLAVREANDASTTSMYVYNTQNESNNNTAHEVAQNQRVDSSVEAESIVNGADNYSNYCDKHK